MHIGISLSSFRWPIIRTAPRSDRVLASIEQCGCGMHEPSPLSLSLSLVLNYDSRRSTFLAISHCWMPVCADEFAWRTSGGSNINYDGLRIPSKRSYHEDDPEETTGCLGMYPLNESARGNTLKPISNAPHAVCIRPYTE